MILSCMWHVAEEVFSRVSVFLAAFRALAFSFSCARRSVFGGTRGKNLGQVTSLSPVSSCRAPRRSPAGSVALLWLC